MKKTIVMCVALAAFVLGSSEAWSKPVTYVPKHRLQKNCGIMGGTFLSPSASYTCNLPSGAWVSCDGNLKKCWGGRGTDPVNGAKNNKSKRQLEQELLN
jgi:hypothetical protein